MFSSFTAYGDSVTAGASASNVGVNDYVSLIATALGLAYVNGGFSGGGAWDILPYNNMFGRVIDADSMTTALIGINDVIRNQSDSVKLAYWRSAMLAQLAWLALLDTAKVKAVLGAGGPSLTGSWADSGLYTRSISTAGAGTATFTTTGPVAYICHLLHNSVPGQFALTTDGVPQGTFDTQTTVAMPSQGIPYGPALIRIAGLAPGTHTHVLTWVSGTVFFCWAGGNTVAAPNPGPQVFSGSVVPQANGVNETPRALYNAAVAADCALLAADGLAVHFVDAHAAVDPVNGMNADGIHLNDTGHAQVADAFLAVIAGLPDPALPPVPTITEAPADPSDTGSATFAFSAADATSYECALDGSGYATCTSPQTYTGLGAGPHTFAVRAVNDAGASAPASYSWSVGALSPSTGLAGAGIGLRRGARP